MQPKAAQSQDAGRKNKQKLKIKQVNVVEKEEKIAIPAKPAAHSAVREKANSAVENKPAVVEPAKDMPAEDQNRKG